MYVMKRKYHPYPKKTKKPIHLSHIFIVVLSVILVIGLTNSSGLSELFPSFSLSSLLSGDSKNQTKESPTSDSSSPNKSTFQSKSLDTPVATIVIDAGHGGPDPGKVSESGTLEKDINLNIAFYIKEMLEAQNISVIMTREEDKDLATETSHRKLSDIKERVKLMEDSNADAIISIHQNSYPDADVYGAQCFYPTNSEEGKNLATILQNQIIQSTNQTKIREIKANDDYYLLKHSTTPIVIVECGFLTNPQEEQLLLDENYQRKMAWAIQMGILKYLNV